LDSVHSIFGIDSKKAILNIVLIVNTFTWYYYAYEVLNKLVQIATFSSLQQIALWSVNFTALAASVILGALLVGKLKRRVPFLLLWIFIGVVVSMAPLLTQFSTTFVVVSIISILFGISFGLGMPACMGYFADSTAAENRSRLGGLIFLLIGVGFFILGSIIVQNIITYALILTVWRGSGLLILLSLKLKEMVVENRVVTKFRTIFSDRQFLLYFLPWCMFSLVNSLAFPIVAKFSPNGTDFVQQSSIVENVLAGGVAVVGGFVADFFGRRRLAIIGFAMLGIGYATVGIIPTGNTYGWWFYTVMDGIAWGAFATIFLMTVWGDLGPSHASEKYYAIGGLPFLFSNFVRISIGTNIANSITSSGAVFSYASFFLFVAVLPLFYAPETLSDKALKDRQLKSYAEIAQKIKEKKS
jgi:MFS family permease